VKRCFEEATALFAPPNEEGCRYFANCLLTYFLPGKKDRSPSSRDLIIKYGQAFLRHLDRELKASKILFYLASASDKAENEALLIRMEEVRRKVRFSIDYFSPKPAQDPIRYLAELAQDLWKETNAGRSPISKTPDGPLCRFLDPVLDAIHSKKSPETISAILHRKRRNGPRYKIGN